MYIIFTNLTLIFKHKRVTNTIHKSLKSELKVGSGGKSSWSFWRLSQ